MLSAPVLLCLLSATAVAAPPFKGKVISVIKGDAITVAHGAAVERVRLYGVAAPGLTQPFGKAARAFTTQIALGKNVRVREIQKRSDGVIAGEVVIEDRKSLSQLLIMNGLAFWNHLEAPNDYTLQALERESRKRGLRLWSADSPTPPWEGEKIGNLSN